MASTTTRKTVAPNHNQLMGNRCVGIFGNGREVSGWIDDTTVTDKGVVCVSLEVLRESDVDCSGVWTSQFRLEQ